jgi:hypothetical protein
MSETFKGNGKFLYAETTLYHSKEQETCDTCAQNGDTISNTLIVTFYKFENEICFNSYNSYILKILKIKY